MPWKNSWFQIAFFALLVSGALLVVDYAAKIPVHIGSAKPSPPNTDSAEADVEIAQGKAAYARQDFTQAMQWYQKAAAQGNPDAETTVGDFYANGWGVQPRADEAVRWYQKAADQGNVRAEIDLGIFYEHGLGVQQDYTEAKKWYQKAMAHGDLYAGSWAGGEIHWMMDRGTPQASHTNADSAEAEVALGDAADFRQDYAQAMQWYQKAAAQGNADAESRIGDLFSTQIKGVKQSYTEAFRWFLMAANQGNSYAENVVGADYESGRGVRQNHAEGISWYQKAAAQGNLAAEYNLGLSYEFGYGVEQNYTEAARWYQKAADQGDVMSQFYLGGLYERGQGVPKDTSEAIKWYQKSAEKGSDQAKQALAKLQPGGTP